MQPLYKPRQYPKDIQTQIQAMPALATDIANRWALGWPKAVQDLIKSGEYLQALVSQEEQERAALSQGGMNHLSSWEKAEVMGLSQSPPVASSN